MNTTAENRLSRLIEKRIHELKGRKTQRDIATEIGYTNQNMITMLKQGRSKLALDRVPAMARALEIDPAYLFRIVLEQHYSGGALVAIKEIFGSVVTKNEAEILDYVRDVSKVEDPKLDDKLKSAIKSAFE